MSMLHDAAAPQRTHKYPQIAIAFLLAVASVSWCAYERGWFGSIARSLGSRSGSAYSMAHYSAIRVSSSRPGDGEADVARDIVIKIDLAGGRIDPSSVNATSVQLLRGGDRDVVPASIKLIAGGEQLIIKPASRLEAGQNYLAVLREPMKSISGRLFAPTQIAFRTTEAIDPAIRFEQVALPTAGDAGFTCVQISSDHRLYASTDEGKILRFPIEPDGALGRPEVFTALADAHHGPRLITGFCFDPRSTAGNPIIWVTSGWYGFENAPDFSCMITRMSGPELQVVEDAVVNLPRSVRDHLLLQPSFGPDGALYVSQASNSAYGAPDAEWGNRPEHLLNAAILRIDTTRLTPGNPLDARTIDAGGSYDPRSTDAPVKIYATGVRLAYDLCWASNGKLYAPTNGSSAGGNTPAGAGAPALTNVASAEDDWLFVIKPGRYYGHPNPRQGHFVLNGGNPTAGRDFAEVTDYPVGTRPDPEWEPAAYAFGKHISANGVIQYRSNTLGGKLKDALMVCRYNGGSDIIGLELNAAGSVKRALVGIPGLTGLTNPLDLIEDPANGNIYVSEYGARKLTLLRPAR